MDDVVINFNKKTKSKKKTKVKTFNDIQTERKENQLQENKQQKIKQEQETKKSKEKFNKLKQIEKQGMDFELELLQDDLENFKQTDKIELKTTETETEYDFM